MNTRFFKIASVAALLILSASFAYGQQTDSSIFRPTSFAPSSTEMGAKIPEPVVLTIHYGGIREKRSFAVGEPLNISIKNVTGGDIWYVRRRPPGVDSVLLDRESISIERLVNGEWVAASGQYPTVIDDPDNQFGPQLKKIGPEITILRRWTPRKPGQYRVKFQFFSTPKISNDDHLTYSETFTVQPA
jgi:hypothetical protein